jgi:hypothetical protein
MNTKLIFPVVFLALVLLVPGSALAQTEIDFKVFVVNTTVHDLGLKAVQASNGDIIPTNNFAITPESVVQVKQGQNLMVITNTNEPERIEKVKVTNTQGVVTDLVYLQNSQYSLSGLNVGVYVLNVIADSPTSASKNAYETLLIILAPDQKPIQKTEITKIIQKTNVDVKIIFKEDKRNDNKQDKCKSGYVFNNKTKECIKTNICLTGYTHTDKGCQPLPKPDNNTSPLPPVNDTEIPEENITPENCEELSPEDCPEVEQDTDDGLPEYVPPTEEEETEQEGEQPEQFFDEADEDDKEENKEQEESNDNENEESTDEEEDSEN